MQSLASYSLIALSAVFILGWLVFETYQIPRRFFIAVGSFLLLLSGALFGASDFLNFHPLIGWLLVSYIIWCFVSNFISSRPDIGVSGLASIIIPVFVCLFFSQENITLGMQLVVLSSIPNCVYAIIQKNFKYEPLKYSTNKTHWYPIGFLGNTNMLGVWLVPQFFLAIWLSENINLNYFFLSLLIVYVIYLTKCRSALVGLTVGIIYLAIQSKVLFSIGALMLVVILCIAALEDKNRIKNIFNFLTDKKTLKERLNYWKIALLGIKLNPIFGYGTGVFKIFIPYIQRELNDKTNGKFLKKENYACPYPRYVHNDFLQEALNHGIIGLSLFLALNVITIIFCKSSILSACLISLLTTGLFFHGFSIIGINILYWFVFFTCNVFSFQVCEFSTTWIYLSIPISFAFCILSLKELLSSYYFQQFMLKSKPEGLVKALKLFPFSGTFNTFLLVTAMQKNKILLSLKACMRTLGTYDGDQRLWELWYNLGYVFLRSNNLDLAEACYKESLSFWPEYEGAKNGLEIISAIRNRMISESQG